MTTTTQNKWICVLLFILVLFWLFSLLWFQQYTLREPEIKKSIGRSERPVGQRKEGPHFIP
jgi:hypothetical protein